MQVPVSACLVYAWLKFYQCHFNYITDLSLLFDRLPNYSETLVLK